MISENNAKIREKAIVNMALKNGNTFAMHCRGTLPTHLGQIELLQLASPPVKELF